MNNIDGQYRWTKDGQYRWTTVYGQVHGPVYGPVYQSCAYEALLYRDNIDTITL